MRRREFVAAATAFASLPMTAYAADRSPYAEMSAMAAQAQMRSGRLTSRALTLACLSRIEKIDRAGPKLASVIEINPDASQIAAELDRERKAGKLRGPLHGVPVLLKDNIATRDGMATTAGSLALIGSRPPRDAALAARLREAGAVLLGKANLSEWANFRSTRSTSGWSARGGLTKNPYALDRNPSGSSSGSAVAVAAGLAPLAVGTETDGSIVSPATRCGVVGFKPTVGRVSRDGVVPISASQDSAGPMARSVADAAALLAGMEGRDERDVATHEFRTPLEADPAKWLRADALRGVRLGVLAPEHDPHPGVQRAFEAALAALRAAGAELVERVELPASSSYAQAEFEVLLHEFKAGLNAYFAEFGKGAPVGSLEQLIAFNTRQASRELRYFGQELLLMSQSRGGLDSPLYREARATCLRRARDEGLDAAFDRHRIAAIVAPTGGTAWLTDLVNGDGETGGFSSLAAIAGYPHLTVPMGELAGLPLGLSFVGPAWQDAQVLAYGHAFEQATRARRAPQYLKTAAV